MESSDNEARMPQLTDALGRKVWDKEYFARKAQLRQLEGGAEPEMETLVAGAESKPKKAKKVPPPPSERRPLEMRKEATSLDVDLGKTRLITAATPKQQQGGYWCSLCECLIKDSQAYLDHINGKRHNRLLGMTMVVERVGADAVRQRLQDVKLQKEKEKEREALAGDDLYGGVEMRLLEALTEEKRQKKEKRKEKKRRKQQQVDGGDREMAEKPAVCPVLAELFPGCGLTMDLQEKEEQEKDDGATYCGQGAIVKEDEAKQRLGRFDVAVATQGSSPGEVKEAVAVPLASVHGGGQRSRFDVTPEEAALLKRQKFTHDSEDA